MALGKCVISTPLSNSLPSPIIGGEFMSLNEYLCIVEPNVNDISKSVVFIISHPEYQRILSSNLIMFWKEYGTPIASLRLLGIHRDGFNN